MKKNTIIYQDSNTIDYVEYRIKEYVDILNNNHKKIMQFNPLLNDKITLFQTFYQWDNNNEFNNILRTNTLQTLSGIIKENSPFYSSEMVNEFYSKLIEKLHKNHIEKTYNGFLTFKEDAEQYKKENITHIGYNNIPYNVHHYFNSWDMVNDLITFNKDTNLFEVNNEHLERFESDMTYLCSNTKQAKIMEQLDVINKAFEEINNLSNHSLCHTNLLTNENKLYIDRNTLQTIQDIN